MELAWKVVEGAGVVTARRGGGLVVVEGGSVADERGERVVFAASAATGEATLGRAVAVSKTRIDSVVDDASCNSSDEELDWSSVEDEGGGMDAVSGCCCCSVEMGCEEEEAFANAYSPLLSKTPVEDENGTALAMVEQVFRRHNARKIDSRYISF